MEMKAVYDFFDEKGKAVAKDKACGVKAGDDGLNVTPEFGGLLSFFYSEIREVRGDDYKAVISLASGEKLVLKELGYQFEDLLRVLEKHRRDAAVEWMLMEEGLTKGGFEAEFAFKMKGGKKGKGACEMRLYETGMVIVPEEGEPVRLHYGDITEVGGSEDELVVKVATVAGDAYEFTKMGNKLGLFRRTLSKIISSRAEEVQAWVMNLLPKAEPSVIRKLVQLMKEGNAVKKKDFDAVYPALWKQLESKIDETEMKEEYAFLKKMSQREKICVGVKRGLMGGLTKEYFWFLIPIYGGKRGEPGNAIAMESISADDAGGRATYFFRLTGRKAYAKMKNSKELDKEVDSFIESINRCMIETNFRREPIYLSDEKLNEAKHGKYRTAIEKVPSLRALRSLFIGRVMHTDTEQWERDVTGLLKFNVAAGDDAAKWVKNAESTG